MQTSRYCICGTPINRVSIGEVNMLPRAALTSVVGALKSSAATLETGNKSLRVATSLIGMTVSLVIRYDYVIY